MAPVAKILWTSKVVTASNVYCIIKRQSDGYLFDNTDGIFRAVAADPYLLFTEHGIIKGLYEVSEGREIWPADEYKVFIYKRAGGSPSPVADDLSDSMDLFIVGDKVVTPMPLEHGLVVADVANTIIYFVTDLTNTEDDYCSGSYLKFVSGTNINQVRRILTYSGTSFSVTLSSGFTAVPTAGDEFIIINQ